MRAVMATPGPFRSRKWGIETSEGSRMGWEFVASWIDDPDVPWQWAWRRVADDSGAVIAESGPFPHLDLCVEDARQHGFDEGDCGPVS